MDLSEIVIQISTSQKKAFYGYLGDNPSSVREEEPDKGTVIYHNKGR